MQNQKMPRTHRTLRLAALAWAILTAGWIILWFLTCEPEHDEVQHLHAAWLIHDGKKPYVDFFEHHSPPLWLGVSLYYTLFGSNLGVIITCRLLTILSFGLVTYLSYQISRRWTSAGGAWLAVLGFPLFSVNYLMGLLYVRGDPFILLLLMVAISLAMHFEKKPSWGESSDWIRILVIFLLLGCTVAISPRAGLPAAIILLTLAWWGYRALPRKSYLAALIAGTAIVAAPTLLMALFIGWKTYFFWVYQFTTHIVASFSPTEGIIGLLKAALPVWLLVLIGICTIARQRDLRSRRGILLMTAMAIANFFGLWLTRQPYMQQFLMTIPFFGFVAGIGYDEFARWFRKNVFWRRVNWAALLLLAGSLLLTAKTVNSWRHRGDATLSYWMNRAQWILSYKERGTFAGGNAFFGPILMEDAHFWWSAVRYATPTLRFMGVKYPIPSLEDLKKNPPAIIHETFITGWGFDRIRNFNDWLDANYSPGEYRGYWVRR